MKEFCRFIIIICLTFAIISLIQFAIGVAVNHKKLNECNKQLNVITEKVQGKENKRSGYE
jgi:hypothetical protein